MRWFSSMVLVACTSSCSLLTQFDVEGQPCDSAGQCFADFFCADSGLCKQRDGGVPDAGPVVDAGTCTARETACTDGQDNDCDGQRDCADTDCNGVACSDGDACTRGEVCSGGVCPRGTAVSCNTPTACQMGSGTCQPSTGTCVYPALPDGTACTALMSARCCAGICIDISRNPSSCGGCGLTCSGAQVCQPIDQSDCLSPEPANTSGRCTCTASAPCPSGQTCTNGTCRPTLATQCAPGQSISLDGGVCGAYCRY